MTTPLETILRSFVRSVVLFTVLALFAAAVPVEAHAAAGSSSPGAEAAAGDSAAAREKSGLEQVYEIGKAWYEHYEAFEQARNDVSLTAPHRLEITPELLKVTENASNRLPGIEVKAGVAWVPYKGQTTTVRWEFEAGNGKGGSGSISRTGAPTKDEWDDWYDEDDDGAWPHAGKFSNDRIKFTFDAVAPGEAFNEGINTVKVKISGQTRVEVNWWNPLNWVGPPCEDKDFEEVVSQERDVTVEVPYAVRKDPNLDRVTQNHQANLTVQLWDKNLARQSLQGNIQNYYDPKVRVLCDNGTVPPDNGTSDNEKMVCSDTRIHVGAHPPDVVHVTPDFDPISITVKHEVWDLPENRNRVYARPLSLRPTQLFCVQPGEPDSVPGTPEEPPTGSIPERSSMPRRNAVTPPPRINDPDYGMIDGFDDAILWEILSLEAGAEPESLWIHGRRPEFRLPSGLLSGDVVEFRYTVRDVFGRHFACSQTLTVPPEDDLAAPADVFAFPPLLELTEREMTPETQHRVEIRTLDLAGLSVGVTRPAPGVHVVNLLDGQTQITDARGRAQFMIQHGMPAHFLLQDPQGRYLPQEMPPTPPILKDLDTYLLPDGLSLQDDRLYFWLNPAFAQGRLAPAAGQIRFRPDGPDTRIGAVSDLDPQQVLSAEWRTVDEHPLAPARITHWGVSDRRGLGYVPARFTLEAAEVPPEVLEQIAAEGMIRLRVGTMDGFVHEVDLPVVADDQTASTGAAPPPEFVLLSPLPNPAAGEATIAFELDRPAAVRVGIYDVVGRRIALLTDGWRAAGRHSQVWNGRASEGSRVPNGIYFVRLESDGQRAVQRLTILR